MSAIQFNLLPDAKMAHVKASRTRNLVVSVAFLASAVSVALVLIVLLAVEGVQKKQLSSADNNVKKYSSQLKNIPNVNKIITVQNQLKTLITLHQSKHLSSRIFSYLSEVTPTDVHINQLSIDFGLGSMQISGTSNSQQSVNTFIDTLKFTTYTVGADTTTRNAFPSVIESSFGLGAGGASYSLTVGFDPILFANNLGGQVPKLSVPKLTTTRSVLADPANVLFNGTLPAKPGQGRQ